MIKTQQIKSTSQKPNDLEGYITVNVLKWNSSKWKTLCPYYLRTDGKEENFNPGGIIFENFYQGSKVYDVVYSQEVYASRFYHGNPAYLWWKFNTVNKNGDVLLDKLGNINYDLYLNWRNSIWSCQNAIRYPNGLANRKNTKFTLITDKDGKQERLNYIDARKRLYVKEYIRLMRNTKEYQLLLSWIRKGEKLLICEIDVPAKNKKGDYGKDCDDQNNCTMNLDKLKRLLDDPNEAFGHGLCLAYALLSDL